jgi:hypothetical protein
MADLNALKAEQIAARDEHERWAMTNTVGQTPEDLVRIDLAYRRAVKRYTAACDAYNKAIEEAI